MTVGYRFPPGPPSEVDLGIAMEGKMMRKTMEKMREYDIKQWEKMGKEGKMMENDEKNNGKMREYDIKQWEKSGKGGENDEKNNGKNERL